jgi:1,4-dihydroxy-2-naphthoate octaprenyltransferase
MGGRTAHLLTTLDMPPWVYRWIYHAGGLQALRRSTLGVCGIRCTRTLCVGPVNHSDAARRDAWRHSAHRLGQTLAAGPLRPHQRVADTLLTWLRAMGLQFFPMRWLAYTLGALVAAKAQQRWDAAGYALGYAVLFFVKLGTVFSNECHDFESDRINRNAGAFNGGSRVLVDGSLRAGQLRTATLLVLSAAFACALVALLRGANPAAATVLMVSALASLGYTMPPLRLSWRGWGELDVALTHSIGVILWGYVLQGADWRDVAPWALSLPLALAILPAILLSSIPDVAADRQAGKRTLAVRHGEQTARALAAASAVAAVGAAWWIGTLGVAGISYAATLPWIALHLLALLALLDVARAPLQAAIVCALAYLMWFVATPLWPLTT